VADEERTEVRLPAPAEAPAPTEVSTPAPADSLTLAQSEHEAAAALERSRLGLELAPAVPGHQPVRKLGQGTYGQVWLYREERTGIQVAIKFFDRSRGQEWLLLQAEVKQLALLNADPGIIQLKDVEPDADPPYYVMNYAPGGSLADRLAGGKTLGVPEALAIFRQVAEALAYVHAKGVRHCDLKPGNVLLDARGRALVADFGQAHLSLDASPALGTFFYMAPEQADLSKAIPDTRWDVYGLGALFYAMVTGRPPREDPAMRDELAGTADLSHRLRRYRDGVRTAPPPTGHRRLSGMDRGLAEIIDRCLEFDPERRPHDAGAVLAALDRRERIRRQRPMLAFGLVAPLLLLAAMAVSLRLLARESVGDAETALVTQARTNNLVTAQLIANVLKEEFDDQVDMMKRPAHDKELRRLLQQTPVPHEKLCERLQAFAPKQEGERWFPRLALADAAGRIVAEDPPKPELRTKQWSWREWYNGERHHFGREGERFPPTSHVGVSGPYVNKETGQPVVSLSYPVREPGADGRVLGVLVGVVPLERLSAWLNDVGLRRAHASVVLLNRHRQFVLHTGVGALEVPADRDAAAAEGTLFERLAGGLVGETADHTDPLDKKTYVAGYAPVPPSDDRQAPWQTGWGVVVQSDRAQVLGPIDGLRSWLHRAGLVALGAVGVLTSGLWAWLVWRLRRQELA
jgi:hypothetical protein